MDHKGKKAVKMTKWDLKKEKLKQAVVDVLRKYPAGLDKNDLWRLVQNTSKLSVNAKEYGVSRISDLLSTWSDVVCVKLKRNGQVVQLRSKLSLPKVDVNLVAAKKSVKVNPGNVSEKSSGVDIDTLIGAVGGDERTTSASNGKKPAVEMMSSFSDDKIEGLDFTFDFSISDLGTDEPVNTTSCVANTAITQMKNDTKGEAEKNGSDNTLDEISKALDFEESDDETEDVADDEVTDGIPVTRPLLVGTILENPKSQAASLPGWSQIVGSQRTNSVQPLMYMNNLRPFGAPNVAANPFAGQPLIRQLQPLQMAGHMVRPQLPGHEFMMRQTIAMNSAGHPNVTKETGADDNKQRDLDEDSDTDDEDSDTDEEGDEEDDDSNHDINTLPEAAGKSDEINHGDLKEMQKATVIPTQGNMMNNPLLTNILPSPGFTQFGRLPAAPVFVSMPSATSGPNRMQSQIPGVSFGAVRAMQLPNMFSPNLYNPSPLGLVNQHQHGVTMPMPPMNMTSPSSRSDSSSLSPASVHEMPNDNRNVPPTRASPITSPHQKPVWNFLIPPQTSVQGESAGRHSALGHLLVPNVPIPKSSVAHSMPSMPLTRSSVAHPMSHLVPDIVRDVPATRQTASLISDPRTHAADITQQTRQVIIRPEDLNPSAATLNAVSQPRSTESSKMPILKFWDEFKEHNVEPVDKSEFEVRKIDVRPVYVPVGKQPTKEDVDKVAKECIEMLAESNEFVTPERVEKLVCQRFECDSIRQLGLRYIEHLDSVNELNRVVCKVNAYITSFLKSRSICTLYELKECLREYVPGKGDFSVLKTGPLQRFPEVYKQFRFPPNMAEIPPITSVEIMDLFDSYLTHANQWTSKVEMEPFMNFLVDKYEADNAYMLGVRIRSLPLVVGVLKKAKRDSATQRRGVYEHFKQNLKDELEEAFSKFKVTILQRGDGDGFEIRKHYLKMQPETAIMEISEKLNILMLIVESGTDRTYVRPKLKKVIEDFLTHMRHDNLGKLLLHLAICMTSASVQEEALELLKPPTYDEDPDDMVKGRSSKQPPRKDAVVESLKKYIKNCLNVRALSLPDFNRMEEKLLEEFGFSEFSQMGFGRFLEFLLRETQKVLEEGGGLQLGSGAGGSADSETSFKPQQDDLYDFIGQCKQCGITQPSEIEAALCKQYSVKEVRHLGYGNIKLLLSHAEKYLRRMNMAGTNVLYETPFSLHAGIPSSNDTKVGMLGHQTKEAAIMCLHNCPLLENMADWSQWSVVFEPQFGTLKNFIQVLNNKGVNQIKIEGGKFAEIDIMAMEVSPGELIKLVSSTSQEHFAFALKRRDVRLTCGHLVSMAVSYKGIGSMPLALLLSHMKSALLQMYAEESSTDAPYSRDSYTHSHDHIAAKFVLQCLLCIPTKLCVSLANQMFLDPLGQVVGSSMSKQLLAQLCVTPSERNQLEKLGCLLGIQDWMSMIQHKFKPLESDIQNLTPELEDLMETADVVQVEEESTDESYEDDFDDIVSGDFDTDITVDNKNLGMDQSDQSSDVSAESDIPAMVDDTVVDKQDNDDAEKSGTEEIPEEPAVSVCETIINQIRKDEFGVGIHLSEDGERLMKVQQERLGRSLDRLSKDLYSKDTHFVLELIQNADDNSYTDDLLSNQNDDCPSVKFVIRDDGIYVLNNELGFKEKDIKALCDVGRSTKGKHKFGYIGQKGIGFKSVFRVTDSPEVHSNGFHIKFDVSSGPMGYILPHWIPTEEQADNNGWTTHIILRLKPDMLKHTRTLAARFNDIHPSLLLFLHRLRKITIENKVENREKTMHRRDVGNNVIEIQHTDSNTCERWLVVKSTLDASKISLQAKSGADVESTEIALAFPIKPSGQKTTHKVLPPKQPVFAFLPLRSYGFRFIIQGDFDVPSSREDVDRDSSWNQWLRNEIHTVFIEALETFKTHPEYKPMDAVCTFLQFVPMEDEVLDFFKPVAADILRKLKGKPCIPTQPNSQGTFSWKIPSQTVRVDDHRIRSVITPELLQTHLNLFYLHSDVAANLNPTLTSCLGIETLNSEHLSKLGCALITDMGTHCQSDNDVIQIAKWLACMYCSLDEFHNEDTTLSILQSQRLLPLSDGELVSLQDKTVFYPIPDSSTNRKDKDIFYYLQTDVNSLHPLLLNTGDDEVNSQVNKLLVRLGIKKMSPGDVINHHIIPVLKSDTWETKSRETLISYLMYIKIQTDKQPSVCNMDDVKDVAVVLTNDGFKHPARDCVHFPQEYGNQINLKRDFPGYEWTILSRCYLPQTYTQTDMISWMSFFKKLGVEDFLSVRKTEVHIHKDDLASSIWASAAACWPEEEEYIVQDYKCVELEKLIQENLCPDGDVFVEQMRSLCVYLDRLWDKYYSKYCRAQVQTKDGRDLKETESSFSMLLHTSQWLPATEAEVSQFPDGSVKIKARTVMKEPSCLYLRSKVIFDLLAENVSYLAVQIAGVSFLRFLGLKIDVAIETVKEQLMTWSSRSQPGEPADFCTTMVHMKNVYRYLSDNLKGQELRNLLQNCPVIFVPNKKEYLEKRGAVIPGKFMNRNEVWLCDNTGLMEKYSSLLKDFHSDLSCKRTMQIFYMDRLDLVQIFTNEGNIDKLPSIDEYLELLSLLCSTSAPKISDILHDVYHIFSTIGRILLAPCQGLTREDTETYLKSQKAKIVSKLRTAKVFPTKGLVWVSLADHPIIADSKEYEKMFENKDGVHFLDMEQRLKKGQGKFQKSFQPKDDNIQQEMIDVVIEMCEIKKLSDVVDIQTAPEMIQPCDKLQAYVHQIVPTLQQYLMASFEDVYSQLEQKNTQQMLARAKFYQTKKIEVSYLLTGMTTVIVELREEKCSIDQSTFYIHREHVDSTQDINKEIARHFSLGDKNCNNVLRHFLSDLSGIISGSTDETVDSLLQRYDAEVQDIPDETAWTVEPPYVPEPEVIEPEIEEPEIEEVEEIIQVSQQEGPFELRMWPPIANENKRIIRADGTERPVSNIWPPPQGMDYMKSVKDLPANIRVSSAVPTPDGSSATTENPGADNESYAAHVRNRSTANPAVPQHYIQQGSINETNSVQPPVSLVTLASDQHICEEKATEEKDKQKQNVNNSADETTHGITTTEQQGTYQSSLKATQEDGESASQEKQTGRNYPLAMNRNYADSQGQQHSDDWPHRGPQQHGQGTKRQWFASDDPAWSRSATEYSFDDLGSSGDLCKYVTFTLEEDAGLKEIGRWGEALVAEYLKHQKELGEIDNFIWKNEESEIGSPYDFEIQYADGKKRSEYIEVKSTCSDNKEVFPISIHQIRFAEEQKDNFHIYRLFNAGNSNLVRLIRISDLSSRLSIKQVKLCMLI